MCTFVFPIKIFSQVCEPLSKPTPHFGVHPGLVFTNAWNMLNSGYGANWGSANMGNSRDGYHTVAYIDRDGWTRADKTHTFGFNIGTGRNPDFVFKVDQVMKCRYKGTKAQMTYNSSRGNNGAVIQNESEAGGYYTWEFRIIRVNTDDNIAFSINGKITEIELMLPGYELNDPRLLTDECRDYLRGVQVLRLYGYSGCNSSMERTWNFRTPANAPFQAEVSNGIDIRGNTDSPYDERANNPWLSNSFNQSRTYPWEKAIDVCNYLDMDFYANVPVLIDLEYARELSKLLKQRLKPTLNVYIEIGNELWNFAPAFRGFAMSFSAVHNMVKVQGDQTIVGNAAKGIDVETGNFGDGTWWTGGMGAYTAARRWPVYRLKQYMDEFSKDWGFADKGGVGVRVRAVLAGQLAYGWGADYWFIGGEGVDFLNRAFGERAATKYLYGLAITHYTNVNSPNINMSVDQIFKEFYDNTADQFGRFGSETQNGNPFNQDGSINMGSNANCEGNELEDILAFAKRNSLKVIAYEGGHEANVQDGVNWTILNNTVKAYEDNRMYTHTKFTTEKWYSWMGYDALFIKNGFFAQKGYGAGYAVSQSIGEQSQQYRAYRDIMDNPAPPLTNERGGLIGVNATTILPGWQIAGYRCSEYRSSLQPDNSGGPASRKRLEGLNVDSRETYIIRNETSGKYALRMNVLWVNSAARYDMYMDGQLVKSDLSFVGNSRGGEYTQWSSPIELTIPYGTHAIHFIKKGSGSVDIYQFEYKLLEELPPAKPLFIYGDLEVCNGNTKAKYEVSPVDFSVCEYEWSGLPTTAKILPLDAKPPVSGQGSYLMYINWGSTPNGTYDLRVRGKNQSKLPGNAWQEGEWREFKVTVKTCGFTVNPTPVCLNQKVTFTPDGLPPNIISYRWDSGDDAAGSARFTTRTTAAPYEYTYTTAGEYSVSLTVTTQATPDGPKTTIPFFNTVNVTTCNAPIVVTPVIYCKGATPVALSATPSPGSRNPNGELKWYTSAIGGTGATTAPVPSTSAARSTEYWVTQMNTTGESDRAKITVTVNDAPIAPLVSSPNTMAYCIGATASVADLTGKVSTPTGSILKWYLGSSTTSTANPTAPNTASATTQVWGISAS
ncbi:MAG: PKD domain-containing protein, partial [Cytophagales bacterium]